MGLLRVEPNRPSGGPHRGGAPIRGRSFMTIRAAQIPKRRRPQPQRPNFSLQLIRSDFVYQLIELARSQIAADRRKPAFYVVPKLLLTFLSITHCAPIYAVHHRVH
jgi:hypothetical protein